MKNTGIHQFRGRLGRGNQGDYIGCSAKKEQSKEEIQAIIDKGMKEYNNQFRISMKQFNPKYINTIAEKLGVKITIGPEYGRADSEHVWIKCMVLDYNEITLGYLLYRDGQIYNVKSYSDDRVKDICEDDFIFSNLNLAASGNLTISKVKFKELEQKAILIRDKDFHEKEQWRAANPLKGNKRRKKLQGKNARYILKQLIQEKKS